MNEQRMSWEWQSGGTEGVNPMASSQGEIAKLDVREGGKQTNLRTLENEVFGKGICLAGYNNK